MQLVLSENWTLTSGRDLPTLVRWAREAEDAGFDSVMISEHIVLGPDAGAKGLMPNPREYALPGNQDPFTPWPNSLLLLASIASVTTRLRLAAAAILAPLRHPLLLARELGTLDLLSEGRLIVLPTVSWSRDEYAALGVPFDKRGQLLDEHLEIWELLWRESPATYEGKHYRFRDVYFEPKAHRPEGPRIWFGGSGMHDALTRRLVRHGHGFNPLGRPTPENMDKLRAAMTEAGRDINELELVGGTRAVFPDNNSCADLDQALAHIPAQLEQGFTTFCIKPSQFTDDPDSIGNFCRQVMRRVHSLV
ncbi:F420-dependent oxidoreductase [Streptomyces diastatochromogenes]|uniref:F420-dependent oxidoreductase n=2 Tax=Streptomyces diastatochromogenes TaxID=42236 RepID=A0A233S058_STRDA|nr:TIGR03619 family F420-dependent LLM class oxidoreductase [Streptomyces diastatochromogenes]MCZ0990849.1 TIGR03619 family F420-dependent LLM class oxidoreductase [Streptomyces diastatochromogenes]OXY89028.1 F420-dependent oxidoreductase [Streptomyces diastatochromogenes]